jgi:uncharacterized protein YoxC
LYLKSIAKEVRKLVQTIKNLPKEVRKLARNTQKPSKENRMHADIQIQGDKCEKICSQKYEKMTNM